MDGEYPRSCTQSWMNRRIVRCLGVSARSAPGLGGPSAVVLVIRPSHRSGQFSGTILDVIDRKQKRVLENDIGTRTHFLGAAGLSA
jgi:hypothetical protein